MTSACSAPAQANDDVAVLSNVLNTFVLSFSVNDLPELVIKNFLNFSPFDKKGCNGIAKAIYANIIPLKGLDSNFVTYILAFLNTILF